MTMEMREWIMECARRFVVRRGYELMEVEGDEFDIVAMDDDTMVVMDVRGSERTVEGFPSIRFDRNSFERRMGAMLKRNLDRIETPCPVRYDTVSIVVLGEGRAAVRHHINCGGTA